mgnify:CR=1 FL=1
MKWLRTSKSDKSGILLGFENFVAYLKAKYKIFVNVKGGINIFKDLKTFTMILTCGIFKITFHLIFVA